MANKYWVGGNGTWNSSSTTNWRTTSGGTTAAAVPTSADVVIFDSNSGNPVVTLTGALLCLDIQVNTGVTVTFQSTGSLTISGNMNFVSGSTVTWNATGTITFNATTSKTITSSGTTFNTAVTFNGAGGNWTFLDDFTMGSTRALTHTNGTIDLNGKDLTVGTYTTAAGTKNITFNGGRLYVLNTGTAFNNAQPTNFTTTAGSNSQFNAIIMYGTGQTFAGAGSTYNCNLYVTNITITGNNTFAGFGVEYVGGGSSAIAITGSNSFGSAEIVNYGYTTTFTLTAGTTQTFTGTGDNKFFTPYSGTVIEFQSATAGTQATISKTFSEDVNTDNITVQDIAFTPAAAADGSTPYVWYVGDLSINNGNVTGAVFIDGSTTKVYLITDTSTSFWQVPSNWNNYNNTIHMIGAGGGGAGGLSTTNNWNGGGGGGGGYTKLLNFVTPYSLIPIAVGTGGLGGSAGSNGSTGAATTIGYNWYSANGGGGGTTGTASATAGGAGGVGATYTGGRGGGVAIGSTTQGRGGAGGGGSAGPNGNGGNGGYNITPTSQSAGAGGGGNGGGANAANASAASASAGGNGWLASGGGVVNGGNGSFGGGGAGTYVTASTLGGLGSMGLDILNTVGSSGGPGGHVSSTGSAARDGTYYGAGGAGGTASSGQVTRAGGSGASGLILIVYSTVTPPFLAQRMVSTGNLLTNTLFDETVLSYHSVNSTAIYASSFNEVAISPINSGLARRIANTGEVQVAGVIDEITGIA
jgi:hypothetical protein